MIGRPDLPSGAASPVPSWHSRLPFFYGYVVVGVAFVLAFSNAGQMWAFSVLAVPMQEDLGWSRSLLYGALTIRGIAAGLVSPFMGRLADQRHGVLALLAGCGVLSAATAYLTGAVTEPWQFVVIFGILGGVANAGQGFVMGAVVVPKWFLRQRSTMVAFTSMGGACSLLVLPPFVSALVASQGWRPVWRLLGLMAVAVTLLPPLLVRRQPEDVGLVPDGRPRAGTPADGPPPRAITDRTITLRQAVRGRNFWLLMVGTALGTLPMTSLTVTIVPLFLDRGLPPELAAVGLSGFGLASFTSRFLWGPIADRFHVRTALSIIGLVSALATVSIFFLPGLWVLCYGALTGFGIGGFVGLYQAVWAVYYGRAHLGAIAGVTQPVITLVMAMGSFLLAFIRDTTGSYDLGLWLYAGAWLLCAGLIYLAHPGPSHTPEAAPR